MDVRKTFCLLALAGVAVLPLGTHAAYDSSAGATGSANMGTGANAGATIDVGASATINQTNEDASTSSDTTQGTSGSANLTGGLQSNGLGIEIISSTQVSSDADLEVFSDNLKVRDEGVADSNAQAAGSADLSYYHRGHLFGLIPIKVKARTWVTTNENGTVQVNTTMPWWSAFVTGTGKVRSEVDGRLASSETLSADVRASADAAARARVLEAIASAHASLATSASANAFAK
jgi:hypothetical protein